MPCVLPGMNMLTFIEVMESGHMSPTSDAWLGATGQELAYIMGN